MSIILSVYIKDYFQEYILPPLNNANYTLLLPKDSLGLREDVHFELENIDGIWKIKSGNDYRIARVNHQEENNLETMSAFSLITNFNERITIIPSAQEAIFHPLKKYRILKDIYIGKDPQNDICYDFNMISRSHVHIASQRDGYYLIDTSTNGTYLNNNKVKNTKLNFGDFINVLGLHIIFLDGILAIDLKENVSINKNGLREMDDQVLANANMDIIKSNGKTIFRRSPRTFQEILKETIEIEEPPELNKREKQPLLLTIGPSLTMALPMLLGCAMMIYASNQQGTGSSLFMYSGLIMAVSSALIGVMWSLITLNYQKEEEEKLTQLRFQTYSQYLVEKTNEVKQKYDLAEKTLNRTYPSVNQVVQYNQKSTYLWSRNHSHEDFLAHRLGLGQIDFNLDIAVPKKKFKMIPDELADKPRYIKDSYGILYNVPITFDLLEHNIIGILGDDIKFKAIDIMRTIVGQIAANNCYTDVKMGFIFDGSIIDIKDISFVKWLPHVWSEDKKVRYVASNKQEINDVLFELTNVLRARTEKEGHGEGSDIPKPYYVIFVSDPKLLDGELFSKYVFSDDEKIGLTTIFLAHEYQELPNNCEFIIENTNRFKGTYSVHNQQSTAKTIQFDHVSSERLEVFARYLSTLQVNEMEEGGEIPNSLTFLDMYGVDRLEELPVQDLWLKNRTYENIRGILGAKAGGNLCYLDVHEKYHGPHGLVAGTTGSGKSETLQTYMLSLAVNYSPDDISFFIIDYKGGGMANLFNGLPHMVGQISNLSGNQIHRAMISIKSENRRRQRIFNENGVNNINAYTKLYKNNEANQPVPHLFIIIDEFAELKREEPEFMKELISVAQVGRSLGVHLILATQKPSGTVDDNIWSNSKFRLCLRVQDTQDSKDMLHKPDAAFITQAGRAYLQVGSDEVFELFQSGYSGAVYDKDNISGSKEWVQLISLVGKTELSSSVIRKGKKVKSKSVKEVTQLDAVKEYLAQKAAELGYQKPSQLWMPELGEYIYLDQIEDSKKEGYNLEIVLGMVDDPENQQQLPFKVDVAKGNIGIVGNIVSGKSTMMQTMAYALTKKFTPEQVNIYALDFSSKMMSAFEDSPHFGGVMYENDQDKIGKFFNMMASILKERKEKFHGGNYDQYIRIHGLEYPAIIIFVDNYASFKEKTEEKYEDQMIQLSKEGLNHGIYLVVSGQAFGYQDITTRVGENLKTMLCLQLADRFAYGEFLHTMQISMMPESYKGRGLALYGKRVLEYQTALAINADNDYQRLEEIKKVCQASALEWTGKRARRVPEIPDKPTYSILRENEEFKGLLQDVHTLPVGYDRDNASVYGIPLNKNYCYLVTGKARTGKSNFMKVMIQSAIEKKAQVCVIDNDVKTFKQFENNEALTYCDTDQKIFNFFKDLLPEFKRRNQFKQELIAKDMEEDEIFEEMSVNQPIFIFLSNLDWFIPTVYKSEFKMAGFLENVISKGVLHNIYFIGELDSSKRNVLLGYGIYESFISYHKGIHFGGKVSEETLLSFDYIPFAKQGKAEKPGIGLLPDSAEGETTGVVVPVARK